MANTRSAQKELRKSAKRAALNLKVKKAYKEAVKHTLKAIQAGEANIAEHVRIAQKALDKAAKRGVIKPNTAARKLSRLMAKVHATEKKA
jgi:small subunit ribosomal protein S20